MQAASSGHLQNCLLPPLHATIVLFLIIKLLKCSRLKVLGDNASAMQHMSLFEAISWSSMQVSGAVGHTGKEMPDLRPT